MPSSFFLSVREKVILLLHAFSLLRGIQKLPPLLQKVGVVSYQHKNVIEKSFPTPRKFTGQEILFLSQNVIPIVGKSPKENKGGPCHHDRGVPLYVGVKQK